MMRRSPLKRSGFKRPERQARQAMLLVPQPLPTNVRMASALALELPSVFGKESPLRDEDYRRLVASLPCCHCGLHLHSQAAHENTGKGRQMKVDDRRTFPLCAVSGHACHEAFDQYRLVPGGRDAHAELGRQYTAATQHALRWLATRDPSARRIVERVIGL